jgi:hypothetical protein
MRLYDLQGKVTQELKKLSRHQGRLIEARKAPEQVSHDTQEHWLPAPRTLRRPRWHVSRSHRHVVQQLFCAVAHHLLWMAQQNTIYHIVGASLVEEGIDDSMSYCY